MVKEFIISLGRQILDICSVLVLEATINFKRVVVKPQTGKCQYIDTEFAARIKAYSGIDCYNRMIDHLRTRVDIDQRSQFPSAKGKNFNFKYLGLKPYKDVAV